MANGIIQITIGGAGGSGGGASSKKQKSPQQITLQRIKQLMHPISTTTSNLQNQIQSSMSQPAAAGAAIGARLLSDAVGTMYRMALMEHNRAFTLKEDYISQNKMNILQGEVSKATSLISSVGSSVASYAAMGIGGGPVGVVAGAVIGGVVGIAKGIMNIQVEKTQKMEQYNMQLNATNAQTSFAASRASLVNNGKGTEY